MTPLTTARQAAARTAAADIAPAPARENGDGARPRGAWTRRAAAWTPYILALVFVLSALRGVSRTDVIDTDAARHAMNGAFIYDLVRGGHLAHPIQYAWEYYRHLPSLSIPYHPPLFPAIEAIFFAIFGVNLFAARLAIAVCVGTCALLLCRLTLATFGRPVLAACITITTFSLWMFQWVARDVMLEFPSFVFILAALYCLRDLDRSYPMRRAIPFAIFAAAAVWTKQHAVFLGAVPFVYTVLARRWRRFLEAPLWISSALFAAGVLGLIRLANHFHGAGVNQMSTSARDIYWIVTSTLPSYFNWIVEGIQGLPGVFAACAIVAYLWGLRKRDKSEAASEASGRQKPALHLYFAWILAVAALLIDLGPITRRYLFFLFPAAIAIGYAWLFHGCRWLWGERRAAGVAIFFTSAWVVAGLGAPLEFLRGPGRAAAAIAQGPPARVLYVGDADGNFIFAVRTLDPKLSVTVVPVAKAPRRLVAAGDLAGICRRYGIGWVVFENSPGPHPWSTLQNALPAVGRLEHSIPLESTRYRWRQGSVDVYRVALPESRPRDELQLPAPGPGGDDHDN